MRFEDARHQGIYAIRAYDLLVRVIQDPRARVALAPVFRDILTVEIIEGEQKGMVTVARVQELEVTPRSLALVPTTGRWHTKSQVKTILEDTNV